MELSLKCKENDIISLIHQSFSLSIYIIFRYSSTQDFFFDWSEKKIKPSPIDPLLKIILPMKKKNYQIHSFFYFFEYIKTQVQSVLYSRFFFFFHSSLSHMNNIYIYHYTELIKSNHLIYLSSNSFEMLKRYQLKCIENKINYFVNNFVMTQDRLNISIYS